jgi:hypothetical protein
MNMMRHVLAGSVIAAWMGTVALAQVRQVQMGGAMDANPQVGSGGSNRPVPGFVPVNGNDIMTGNVSGLGYFHGRVGTVNQYQFQGNLGSASLQSFARQSAGSPANGGTYLGIAQPYYLPSATVSTGAAGYNPIPTGSGFDSSLIPRTAYSPLISGAEIRTLSGASVYGVFNREATAAVVPGSPGAVTSSSLFLLRTTELPTTRPDIGAQVPASMPAGGLPENGIGATGSGQAPPNPGMIPGAVSAGVRVGGQTPDLKNAMVSDNYLKLAAEIKTIQGVQPPTTEPGGGKTAVAMGGAADIDPLTGLPRQTRPLPPLNGRGGLSLGGSATTPARGGASSASPSPSAQRLTELSDNELKAGGKIKPVRIAPAQATGAGVSGYDLLMVQAEKKLADGKFLDAAESFQNALALKPDDPLAVIGRAHAELGAGIYAGSEFDLKFVFTRKPELVGLKYQENSFVPALRQEFLLKDLKDATTKKEMANMASFLYCYICYETGRQDLLAAELKDWGARAGHDEWQSVAARAWGAK